MKSDVLKVLIVDDSDAYRGLLCEVLTSIEGAEVVAAVSSGRLALGRLKQTPVDMVLLDIEMPFMDGVEVLERIRESYPDIGVVMVSAFHYDGTDKVIKALEMGALDFVSKVGMDDDGADTILGIRRRLTMLMGLFRARRNARFAKQLSGEGVSRSNAVTERRITKSRSFPELGKATGHHRSEPVPRRPVTATQKIELVAIGVSTGGPNALTKVIPMLPNDLGTPILLVQHMPAILTASLADSLNKKSAVRVQEAIDGEEIVPNTVYLAPGGRHMTVTRKKSFSHTAQSKQIRLNDGPPVNSCRPSVDVLFRSILDSYDGTVLAVIMTGMGSDGAEGVRALKGKNCYCLAQSEDSCVIYGMPRAIDEAGLSDESVALDYMAERIVQLVKGPGRE
jgi:two-component system chemotaxis response regulator CheB